MKRKVFKWFWISIAVIFVLGIIGFGLSWKAGLVPINGELASIQDQLTEIAKYYQQNGEKQLDSNLVKKLNGVILLGENQKENLEGYPSYPLLMATAYFYLANHQQLSIDVRAAINSYHKSILLARKISILFPTKQRHIGDIHNSLHLAYLQDGDLPKAEEYCNKAIEYYEKNGSKTRLGMAKINLANIFLLQEEFDKGIDMTEKAMSDYMDTNLEHQDSTFYVGGLRIRSIIEAELAKRNKSSKEEKVNLHVDSSLYYLREVLSKKAWFNADELKLQWPIMIQTVIQSWINSPLQKEVVLMDNLFQEVEEGLRLMERSDSNLWMAAHEISKGEWLLMKKDYEDAGEWIKKGFSRLNISVNSTWGISQKGHDRVISPQILNSYARSVKVLMREGYSPQEQLDTYTSIIILMEQFRQLSKSDVRVQTLFNEQKSIYTEALNIAYSLRDSRKVLNTINKFSEDIKARLLSQRLHHRDLTKNATGEKRKWLEKDDDLRRKLLKLQAQMTRATEPRIGDSLELLFNQALDEREQFRVDIQANQDGGIAFFYELISPQVPSITEIQKVIPQGQAVVQFVDMGEELMVLTITKKQVKVNKTQPYLTWSDALTDYQDAFLNDIGSDKFAKAAYKIYQNCLEEAITDLDAITELVIIRDGELSNIGFEALVIKDNQGIHYQDMDYLVKDFAISYDYLLSSYYHNLIKNQKENLPLLVCTPDYSKNGDGACDPARDLKSLRALAKKLIAENNGIELSDNKTKLLQQLHGNSNIYFAAHGEANSGGGDEVETDSEKLHDRDPLAYHIYLRGDDETDCRLMLGELLSLNLTDSDIVLGSCSTEQGRSLLGTSVMTIAQSFRIAGARSLIANLRIVKEVANAKQLELYFEYRSAHFSKARALQMAKKQYLITVKEIESAPYQWANLVLLGDAS